MPFFHHAHIELVAGARRSPVFAGTCEPSRTPSRPTTSATSTPPTSITARRSPARIWSLLDTTTTEGGGPFCGSFVGTSFIFSDNAELGTLEGDPRFFFDDSQTPQAQGTGTEEWGGGGDYWGGQTMTLPFAGHPSARPIPARRKKPRTRSSRPTASCSPT